MVSLFPHPASFRFRLTTDTLAFGYLLPATGRIRVFHPLETCAAGRTQTKRARSLSLRARSAIMGKLQWYGMLEERLVLEGVRLNFAHHVEDGAVARLKHGDNLVLKLNRIGAAHTAVSLLLERFNGNVRNARIEEVLAACLKGTGFSFRILDKTIILFREQHQTVEQLKNYKVQTNQFMKKNGVNGYLDATGKYTTGWVIVSNAKNLVRYIDPSGNGFARNKSMRVNGILYYFDRNGYRITDLTNRYRGPYSVQVDRVNGVMTVYADSARTIPVKTIRVSVGLAGTPTPTGNFTLSRSLRWQPLMGPSWGQYGTHVDGAGQGGIFVHSVACGQANSYNLPAVEYNKLGSPASHGCIRTCVADAKWVYENCNGASISIIDGQYKADDAMKGPLGKKALTPLRGAANFDPTDPAV